MKYIEKILIIVVIVIILIVAILLVNLKLIKKEENEGQNSTIDIEESNLSQEEIEELKPEENYTIDINTEISNVAIADNYFIVENCVNEFINANYKKDKNEVVQLLDKTYKDRNNINLSNIENYIYKFETPKTFFSNEMKQKEKTLSYIEYYVSGIIHEKESFENIEQYNCLVILDFISGRFSIIPLSKEQYDQIVSGKLTIETNDSIEKNDFNKFKYINIDDQTICQKLLEKLNYDLNYNKQKVYESLDKQYTRFSSYSEFEKYTIDNKDIIEKMQLSKYEVKITSEYTEYVCVDEYNNYYIFHKNEEMNYTLYLDDYTVLTDKFKEEYAKLDEQAKCQVNIGIFIKMINNKDYKGAYNKLSKGFRNNYFKTLDEFEQYAKNNFYEYNGYSFVSVTTQGDIYLFDVEFINAKLYASDRKQKTINIRLGENYEFELSFNVE